MTLSIMISLFNKIAFLIVLMVIVSGFLEARVQTDSTHVFRGKQLIAPLWP